MNLVVDIGNTLVKIAVFSDNEIVFSKNYKSLTKEELSKLVKEFNITQSIIANVRNEDLELENYLKETTQFTKLNHSTKVPFENKYTFPSTLGLDRVALASATVSQFKNEDVLVIGLGTCITYDFVDKNKNYYGGAISPGLEMRLKALHEFTGKLPLVEIQNNDTINLIGDSTSNSIKSGVYYGIKKEIEGIISEYLTKYPTIKIVLTGGNFELFDLESKNRIFADKFFLLQGLNEIIKINE